ncbi:hypothetical protein [Rhizobium sp. PAMB 3182]
MLSVAGLILIIAGILKLISAAAFAIAGIGGALAFLAALFWVFLLISVGVCLVYAGWK